MTHELSTNRFDIYLDILMRIVAQIQILIHWPLLHEPELKRSFLSIWYILKLKFSTKFIPKLQMLLLDLFVFRKHWSQLQNLFFLICLLSFYFFFILFDFDRSWLESLRLLFIDYSQFIILLDPNCVVWVSCDLCLFRLLQIVHDLKLWNC